MVGHHDEFVDGNAWKMQRNALDAIRHNTSHVRQSHHSVPYFAKYIFPIPRADRHEIRSAIAVIESGQPDRSPMMTPSIEHPPSIRTDELFVCAMRRSRAS
jgi:hypothetical protein